MKPMIAALVTRASGTAGGVCEKRFLSGSGSNEKRLTSFTRSLYKMNEHFKVLLVNFLLTLIVFYRSRVLEYLNIEVSICT